MANWLRKPMPKENKFFPMFVAAIVLSPLVGSIRAVILNDPFRASGRSWAAPSPCSRPSRWARPFPPPHYRLRPRGDRYRQERRFCALGRGRRNRLRLDADASGRGIDGRRRVRVDATVLSSTSRCPPRTWYSSLGIVKLSRTSLFLCALDAFSGRATTDSTTTATASAVSVGLLMLLGMRLPRKVLGVLAIMVLSIQRYIQFISKPGRSPCVTWLSTAAARDLGGGNTDEVAAIVHS
jgi:hypothetical protein